MKQRISPKQLQELTEEQGERLKGWWTPKWGDVILDCRGNIGLIRDLDIAMTGPEADARRAIQKEIALPLLSIGQMIEFIMDKQKYFGVHWPKNDTRVVSRNGPPLVPEGRELADALWQLVQEVLSE